jgi:hypothetical protein
MNESTLTQLKILVERAVRPVRASTPRKRKMREELLAHVVGVFEEESSKLVEDRAALERTAMRFGGAEELTCQLQESVPARDAVRRFLEGRPGELGLRTAARIAGGTGLLALAVAALLLGIAWFSVGQVGTSLRDVLLMGLCSALALPTYLGGIAILAVWMEKWLYSPAGRSWLKIAFVAVGSWLFLLLFLAGAGWPIWPMGWDNFGAVSLAAIIAAGSTGLACELAKSVGERKRYHEEWACLAVEIPS